MGGGGRLIQVYTTKFLSKTTLKQVQSESDSEKNACLFAGHVMVVFYRQIKNFIKHLQNCVQFYMKDKKFHHVKMI